MCLALSLFLLSSIFISFSVGFFTLFSFCDCQATAAPIPLLRPYPSNPLLPATTVAGPTDCRVSNDESYAICASKSDTAVKFTLKPFAFAAQAPQESANLRSCAIYDATNQSTSRALCVHSMSLPVGVFVYFVADMSPATTITGSLQTTIGDTPAIVVDSGNATAYVSSGIGALTPRIHKIVQLDTPTPYLADVVLIAGAGDLEAYAVLLVFGFLYSHLAVSTCRLTRIRLADFTWNGTIDLGVGYGAGVDSLANDDNYVYDLVSECIIVRVAYSESGFRVLGSLDVKLSASCSSLAISPNKHYLFGTSTGSNKLFSVNLVNKQQQIGSFEGGPSVDIPNCEGRPIVLENNVLFGFESGNARVYEFAYGIDTTVSLNAIPTSPYQPAGSNLVNALACVVSSDQSFAVCGSSSNIPVKFNLNPVSLVASGRQENETLYSCGMFEPAARVMCAKGSPGPFLLFYGMSDLTFLTPDPSVSLPNTGPFPAVAVDSGNRCAYVSSFWSVPNICRIENIDGPNPSLAGTLTLGGVGDQNVYSLIFGGENLWAVLDTSPLRLSRVSLSHGDNNNTFFKWNGTVEIVEATGSAFVDNVASDNVSLVYVVTSNCIVVRFHFDNSSFSRLDSLRTPFTMCYSIGISPDATYLFAVSGGIEALFMIRTKDFIPVEKVVSYSVPKGRPIILNLSSGGDRSLLVYSFSATSGNVYQWNTDAIKTRTRTLYSTTTGSSTTSSTSTSTFTSTTSTTASTLTSVTAPSTSSTTPTSSSTSTSSTTTTLTTPTTTQQQTTTMTTATNNNNNRVRSKTKTPKILVTTPVLATTPPVLAPIAQSVATSAGAAVSSAVSGDLGSSALQASRALSLSAIASACTGGVIFATAPPTDMPLPFPQGSFIPQLQIGFPDEPEQDRWRRNYRPVVFANFIIVPMLVLPVVAAVVYGLRHVPQIQRRISSNYLFTITKGSHSEYRQPDLVADSRLIGVAVFIFGVGLEGATCSFVTLLATPRNLSSSLGLDVFISVLAILIILGVFLFLIHVVVLAKEKLECIQTHIRYKNQSKKPMTEKQIHVARFVYGSLGWTYKKSFEESKFGGEQKIEDAKTFFLRFKTLFSSNQGPGDANDFFGDSLARRFAPYALFVDCFFTFLIGIFRGLVLSGVIDCDSVVVLLIILQGLALFWVLTVQNSLYPITKITNIVIASLLLIASFLMLFKSENAGGFAITVAMILSFSGMVISLSRLFIRKVLKFVIYPLREKDLVLVPEHPPTTTTKKTTFSFHPQRGGNSRNNKNNNNYDDDDDVDNFFNVPLIEKRAISTNGRNSQKQEESFFAKVQNDFDQMMGSSDEEIDNYFANKESNKPQKVRREML